MATTSRSDNEEMRFLTIKILGRLERINIDDISYIKAEGAYSLLLMQDKREYLHEKNLGKLLGLLPEKYSRVHRSCLVAMDRVKALLKHEGSRYELELINGECIPLGRTRYKELKSHFD